MTNSDLVKFIVCSLCTVCESMDPISYDRKEILQMNHLSLVEIVCEDNMHRTILYRVQCTLYILHTVRLTKHGIFGWWLNFNHWENSKRYSVDFVFNGTGFTS